MEPDDIRTAEAAAIRATNARRQAASSLKRALGTLFPCTQGPAFRPGVVVDVRHYHRLRQWRENEGADGLLTVAIRQATDGALVLGPRGHATVRTITEEPVRFPS